jgi:hypothetical protein
MLMVLFVNSLTYLLPVRSDFLGKNVKFHGEVAELCRR